MESREALEDTILTNGYLNVTKTGTHITPQRVYDIIYEKWGWTKEEMFDPCPANAQFDGLDIIWHKRNYVNPEFDADTVRAFYRKAEEQWDMVGNSSIMLLPSKTDMDWFHDINSKYDIHWIRGRLKFEGEKDNAPGAHFLVKIGI